MAKRKKGKTRDHQDPHEDDDLDWIEDEDDYSIELE